MTFKNESCFVAGATIVLATHCDGQKACPCALLRAEPKTPCNICTDCARLAVNKGLVGRVEGKFTVNDPALDLVPSLQTARQSACGAERGKGRTAVPEKTSQGAPNKCSSLKETSKAGTYRLCDETYKGTEGGKINNERSGALHEGSVHGTGRGSNARFSRANVNSGKGQGYKYRQKRQSFHEGGIGLRKILIKGVGRGSVRSRWGDGSIYSTQSLAFASTPHLQQPDELATYCTRLAIGPLATRSQAAPHAAFAHLTILFHCFTHASVDRHEPFSSLGCL
ncbi:hypothetical protein EDB85DRAFT_2276536 [Lactarius pseudohatsudake]|nr:hypothetical protein EDB85DRAFT_2276536 [Lactarius pseudohatsudake]